MRYTAAIHAVPSKKSGAMAPRLIPTPACRPDTAPVVTAAVLAATALLTPPLTALVAREAVGCILEAASYFTKGPSSAVLHILNGITKTAY